MKTISSNVENVYEPAEQTKKSAWKVLKNQKYLYYMSIPFVLWVFVFQYLPLWGWTMAFQKIQARRRFF